MPVISVIIPAYNAERYLEKSLESVLNQTYKDFEIIIVNDGSTDATDRIARNFVAEYPDVIQYFQQSNRGVGAARNTGIAHAKGQYLAFLDADDRWLPQKLQVQIDFMKRNPEYGFSYSDVFAMDDDNHCGKRMMMLKHPRSGYIFYDLLKENFVSLPTSLIKKECLQVTGAFCEEREIMSAEDHHFWLKTALFFKGGYINQPLAYYRLRPGSISSCKVKHRKICIRTILKIAQQFPDVYKKGKKHFQRALAILYYETGYILYRRNEFRDAFFYFIESIRQDWTYTRPYKLFFVLTIVPNMVLKHRNVHLPDDDSILFRVA